MSMTNDQISEFQFYLQMYDKGMISKKTVLEKISINPETESKRIKKEYKELQQQQQLQTPNMSGLVGGELGSEPAVEDIQQNKEPY